MAKRAAKKGKQHSKDSDCTIDRRTGLCKTCHVMRGPPCRDCKGRSFHKRGCPDGLNHDGRDRVTGA